MTLLDTRRPRRPLPSPGTPSTIFLDEVGEEFLEDLPSEAPPVDEIDSEVGEQPNHNLDSLADEA